jgi:DNA mismatch endonuclease (patch repair protein)
MSRIKSANTKPEIVVRSLLHRMGYRFRLHRKDLPGKPDIVLPKYKLVIFVHGCFWHQHKNCTRANVPKTNSNYWIPKLQKNVKRDKDHRKTLRKMHWNVIVVWECMVKDLDLLAKKLRKKLVHLKNETRQ